MSSIVQLKRSALSGKVPGTGSLNLGELAVNTYDGKIYFKKSGSIESVESILTTNSVVTGSIRLEGTGSFGSLKVNDTLTVNHGETIISGSALVTNDLTILGAVNARQFNISVISSSVLFESGSSKFGNTSDDVHSFTGSVNITGSFLLNGQEVGGGTTSGSFTGSFTGDGSGLRGVVSDDIPRDGWDYNANSSASISDFNNTSDKYLIDFEQSQSTAVGTPIGYKGFIANASGSTQILPTLNSIDFVIGNNVVASIDANGIQATIPTGTISGSSQLTSSYDSRYVLSGSITQTTWDNIASKPSGIVSGSSQLTSSVLATTGSNTFRGTQTLSGSIIPATDNTYDLGSATYQWRDIYVSSGSLYIDGTKVLGSTGNELQITTDEGQSIKILEAGTDNIILQSADGDIQLKTSGGGNLLFDPTTGLIDVRGTLQIQDGYKITSSGGNGIVFGNNIVVSGSFESTGNINGINLTTFSSSIASTLSNQNTATSSYETKGRGIVSGSSQITYASISSIPSDIVSGSSQITLASTIGFTTYSSSVDSRIATEKGRVDAILLAADADKDSFAEIVTLINSVDTSNDSTFASFYTASVNRLNNLEATSGSVNTSVSNLNTFSGSALTRLSTLEVETANLESFTSSINTTIKTRLNAETVVSGSSQVIGILSSLNTYTGSNDTLNTAQNSRLTSIESATGSYETKGRGIVSGSSQITFSGISSLPTLVSGSSQITLSSTTGYGSVLNQAVLTSSSPTFAGATINGNVSINTSAAGLLTLGASNSYGSVSSGGGGATIYLNGATRGGTTTAASNTVVVATDGDFYITNGAANSNKMVVANNGNAQINGDVTAGSVSTTSNNIGFRVNHGSSSGGYGKIRFYENETNINTIHSFSTLWGTSFSAQSRGALNIEGYNGVTIGQWDSPDMYVTRTSGNTYIKGTLTVGSTITENSSLRYKENIETVKYGLDKVLQMRGVTYDKKNTGVKELGVIAEEIYEVLPEVVLKNEEGEIDSVSYGRITAVLIEAIKEQQKQIEELKSLIK